MDTYDLMEYQGGHAVVSDNRYLLCLVGCHINLLKLGLLYLESGETESIQTMAATMVSDNKAAIVKLLTLLGAESMMKALEFLKEFDNGELAEPQNPLLGFLHSEG